LGGRVVHQGEGLLGEDGDAIGKRCVHFSKEHGSPGAGRKGGGAAGGRWETKGPGESSSRPEKGEKGPRGLSSNAKGKGRMGSKTAVWVSRRCISTKGRPGQGHLPPPPARPVKRTGASAKGKKGNRSPSAEVKRRGETLLKKLPDTPSSRKNRKKRRESRVLSEQWKSHDRGGSGLMPERTPVA